MKTLTDRLNFSVTKPDNSIISIKITEQLNCYNRLTHYCNSNTDISEISISDFDSAVIAMENFNTNCEEDYYFWID